MTGTNIRSSIFLKALEDNELLQESLPLNVQNAIHLISESHAAELQPSTGLFFSEETQRTISRQSGSKLASKLNLVKDLDESHVDKAWSEVREEFYRQNHWHLPTLNGPPAITKENLTRDQKIFREMFSYIWAFIQAALVMKIFVFYFGLNSAEDNDGYNIIFLIIALLFSAGSLGFFAYRKSKKS